MARVTVRGGASSRDETQSARGDEVSAGGGELSCSSE